MRRRYQVRGALFGCAFAVLLPVAANAQGKGTLASEGAGVWWTSAPAPSPWAAPHPGLSKAIIWNRVRDGVEQAVLDIEVNGGPLRVHTVLVRFDPLKTRPELVRLNDRSGVRGSWTVDSAGPDVIIAVNAGQFAETGPWGWIVDRGAELAGPQPGPLAIALAFDDTGAMQWLEGPALAAHRASPAGASGRRRIQTGFQSYPTLLRNGRVPAAATGVDPDHRDARLALGQARDGKVILALTRFGARENVASRIPIGLTYAETAALMGALGARDAVMLDGGLSAQLMVRRSDGAPVSWNGVRRVPVGLVFRER